MREAALRRISRRREAVVEDQRWRRGLSAGDGEVVVGDGGCGGGVEL
jgi:hypothetical protein